MADNPFTKPSISGYNASPPPDDGTTGSDNEITWAKHKTKLADPLNTFATAIADNAETAFASTINTGNDQNNSMGGSLAWASSELTIATGAVTATRSHHTIDTESDASSDDLDTITATSVSTGALLVIRAANAGRTVVVKHGTGNILMGDDADFTMDDADKRLFLQYDGSNWNEIARSPALSDSDSTQISDNKLNLGTVQATTSGTTITFSSLPTSLDRITILLDQLSLDASTDLLLQIGDSGGLETSGYVSSSNTSTTAGQTGSTSTAGFVVYLSSTSSLISGSIMLFRVDGNDWVCQHSMGIDTNGTQIGGGGAKTLSGDLDRVALTTVSGTANFDAGQMNVFHERGS